jgi:hypothetical protein
MKLGFLPGNREDSNYQLSEEHVNVDLPAGFIDNDYENPDLERFLEEWHERRPQVAVIGDAYDGDEALMYQAVIDDLVEDFPYKRFIVTPKSVEAFEYLNPETTVLGYPNGNSPIQGEDLGPVNYRDFDVHILGGNPYEAVEAIDSLTQPTIDGRLPANIVGYDCNLPLRMAHWEYWTPEGWKDNGALTPRETARRSYREIKKFLQDKDLWPETEPVDLYGQPTKEPDELIWMDDGGDPIGTIEDLEKAYVGEYEEQGKLAFRSEVQKKFIEYREDLTKV